MTKQEMLNEQHALDPQPGDYWHDRFSGVLVVLGVTDTEFTFCNSKIDTDPGHWEFDVKTTVTWPKADFERYLAYGSCKGYWADVIPGRLMETVEDWRSLNENT